MAFAIFLLAVFASLSPFLPVFQVPGCPGAVIFQRFTQIPCLGPRGRPSQLYLNNQAVFPLSLFEGHQTRSSHFRSFLGLDSQKWNCWIKRLKHLKGSWAALPNFLPKGLVLISISQSSSFSTPSTSVYCSPSPEVVSKEGGRLAVCLTRIHFFNGVAGSCLKTQPPLRNFQELGTSLTKRHTNGKAPRRNQDWGL